MNNEIQIEKQQTILVYVVVRYGNIIGCYKSMEDASQVASSFIAKGQICDISVKPLN